MSLRRFPSVSVPTVPMLVWQTSPLLSFQNRPPSDFYHVLSKKCSVSTSCVFWPMSKKQKQKKETKKDQLCMFLFLQTLYHGAGRLRMLTKNLRIINISTSLGVAGHKLSFHGLISSSVLFLQELYGWARWFRTTVPTVPHDERDQRQGIPVHKPISKPTSCHIFCNCWKFLSHLSFLLSL